MANLFTIGSSTARIAAFDCEEEMIERGIVCCADLHLRPDKPACRAESLEDWISLQLRKLSYILDFAYEHDAEVVIAGDICHRATGWPS
ncbi:MAG: hypothetical protein M0P18_10755, partial [Syntrophales bacterium]|nr:hypothetical protein [Syntrophales bacterium]